MNHKAFFISVLINIILSITILCLFFHHSWSPEIEESSKNESAISPYWTENSVDQFFNEKLNDISLNEIEVQTYQEAYAALWKSIYNDISSLIQKKCIYPSDISNLKQFTTANDIYFNDIKPLLLNVMLDNFTLPDSPEKDSWGNGTYSRLQFVEGMIYRNACMLLIDYVDYTLPSTSEVEAYMESYISE